MVGDGTDTFWVSDAASTELLNDEGHGGDTLPAHPAATVRIDGSHGSPKFARPRLRSSCPLAFRPSASSTWALWRQAWSAGVQSSEAEW